MAELTPHQKFYRDALKRSEKDRWEEAFAQQLRGAGINFQQQHRFHPVRMWRFDFAIPDFKLGIEIQGGIFERTVTCNRCNTPVMRRLKDGRLVPVREGGRHNTGAGLEADAEKMNAAVAEGWKVLTFTSKHIKDRYAISLVQQMIDPAH